MKRVVTMSLIAASLAGAAGPAAARDGWNAAGAVIGAAGGFALGAFPFRGVSLSANRNDRLIGWRYLNFRALTETAIVMLSLPFALVGGLWLLWWLNFDLSVAVAVGFIALAGDAAETGVVMLIYLEHAWSERRAAAWAAGRTPDRQDLHEAIMVGAVERVRPKMMTVLAIMAGLVPILWSTGTGSEVTQRIAVPTSGGMVSSTVLTLVVIPTVYGLIKGWRLPRRPRPGVAAHAPEAMETIA